MEIIPLFKNDYVEAFGCSYIGGRIENQDSYGSTVINGGFLMTVCDGMGGGPGGKTASSIAVDTILTHMKNLDAENTIKNNLIRAIRAAHEAIIAKGQEQSELRGMGSTCTAVVITPEVAYVAHVGDSRVYLLRGHKKIFRTNDHSMVFELIKAKMLTEEQARLSEQSNIITRALGVAEDLEVEISEVSYRAGDRFMLCTDGIHGTMPEPELIKLVTDRKRKLGVVVSALVERVNSLGVNKGNHHDNLTVIMADCFGNSENQPACSTQQKGIWASVGIFALLCLVFATVKYLSKPSYLSDPSSTPVSEDTTIVQGDSASGAIMHPKEVEDKDSLPNDSENEQSQSN